MSNPIDHKPFRNDLSGRSAGTKQHIKPNSNISGWGKGKDITHPRNKLSMPVTRVGSSTGKLVKRTYTDVAPGLQGGLRETIGVLSAIKKFFEGEDPFQSLFNRIRHARKLGDRAKEEVAKGELEVLAKRYGKTNDPEVLEFF